MLPVLPLIVDFENIGQRLESLDANAPYKNVLCLVTRDGDPLTKVRIYLDDDEPLTPDLVKSRLIAAVPAVAKGKDNMDRPGAPQNARGLPATVVVATRNRPEQLVECLTSILEGTAPVERLIVVDNAPSDNRTAELTGAA